MKTIVNLLFISIFLLGLTACNQTNGGSDHQSAVKAVKTSKTKTESSPIEPASANATDHPKISDSQDPATFVKAVDGDTIKVIYKGKEESVRYLLVDTPEEKKPNTCVQPYAVDAYKRNKELLSRGRLTLEFDIGNKTDKYGRLLAYVFVNGKSVQEQLLKEGYARVAYIYEPTYKYLDEFRNDENQAKGKKLRIWLKPGYATDHGFIGCIHGQSKASITVHSTTSTGTYSTTSAHSSAGVHSSTSAVSKSNSGTAEMFANCTELRKKYPNGVPKGHPAYQEKLDRDHDGYACE